MIDLTYALYVKFFIMNGWRFAQDGAIAGTTGLGATTDAFQIYGFPFPVEYRVHVQDLGWLSWVPAQDGQYLSGVGRRLEAIEFRFPNGVPADSIVLARTHLGGQGWGEIKVVDNGVVLGTVGEARRLEAIQIVAGPKAEEAELRSRLDKCKNDNLTGIVKTVGPAGSEAYKIAPHMSVIGAEAIAFPYGTMEVTIVAGGPFPLYYHTEGNPPFLGENDNGVIQPGGRSQFTLHPAGPYAPVTYIEASQGGPVECVVFTGPLRLPDQGFQVFGPDGPSIIDYIHKIFEPKYVPPPPANMQFPIEPAPGDSSTSGTAS